MSLEPTHILQNDQDTRPRVLSMLIRLYFVEPTQYLTKIVHTCELHTAQRRHRTTRWNQTKVTTKTETLQHAKVPRNTRIIYKTLSRRQTIFREH